MAAMFSLLQVLLLVLALQHSAVATNCKERERHALLELKKGFKDPSKRLFSWEGQDNCCMWEGVQCDNKTGNVIGLDLRNTVSYYQEVGDLYIISSRLEGSLGGEISSSLIHLQYLKHLDLSGNYFLGKTIPSFISQLKELR